MKRERNKMTLTIDKIQNEILDGRLNSSEFIFTTNDSMLFDAIAIINQYNTEPNQFVRESLKTGVDSAQNYINEYKAKEIKIVDEIVKRKEEEKAIQLEKRTKAIKIIPKLSKSYSDLESLLNEIISLDESVLRNPFNYYSNRKVSNDEIISDFKSMIMETTKGAN